MPGIKHPITPDGRYFVVKGRLWRMSNPSLSSDEKQHLVQELMSARRAVKSALDTEDRNGELAARADVDRVKRLLGERGPVWWTDGAPDLNRTMVKNTRYRDWFTQRGEDNGKESTKGSMEESQSS